YDDMKRDYILSYVTAPIEYYPLSLHDALPICHNVGSEAEVDEVMGQAIAAGARLIKPAQKTFWGGYSGYFQDPDDHLWEVVYNPDRKSTRLNSSHVKISYAVFFLKK